MLDNIWSRPRDTMYLVIIVTWLALPTTYAADGVPDEEPLSEESLLINSLLARYERTGRIARPVRDSRHTVDVSFGIRLVHLELDEKEQVMTTSVWTRMTWYDENLKWNSADYNSSLTTVIVPVDKIWTPDIVLVNTAVTNVKEQLADAIVRVTGQVVWAPQRKYSSACLIDVTQYPYDRHTCDMWFQSIANPSENVNITAFPRSALDLDTYLSSYKHAQEWEIISNTSTWHKRPRDVGMILMWSRRAALKFSLTVQRRAGFKGVMLIVPCTLLSFLIPLVFCLPPERPDRHSLAMSLFGSLTILLFLVNEVAPPSASFVPKLALYYCFNLLALLIATCCSVAVVNISKRGETRERVPRAIRYVFIKMMGRVLCFGERLKHLSEVKKVSKRRPDPNRAQNIQYCSLDELESGRTQPQTPAPQSYPGEFEYDDAATVSAANDTSHVLAQIHSKLHRLESRLRSDPQQRNTSGGGPPPGPDTSVPLDVRVEWRTLALVLDRLFSIIFLLVDFISFAAFHPHR